MANIIFLNYGDIVKIISPKNSEIDNKTFYIDYIDNIGLHLLNVETKLYLEYDIDGGLFLDKDVIDFIIISSVDDTNRGFALQNNLIIGKWIDIKFDFEFFILTGEIIDLKDDTIKVQLWDSNSNTFSKDTIEIDFKYHGLHKELHLKSITLRDDPKGFTKKQDLEINNDIIDDEYVIDIDEGYIIDNIDEKKEEKNPMSENEEFHSELNKLCINSSDIVFGEQYNIIKLTEKDERYRLYNINEQKTDFIDTLLSIIPNYERNDKVLENIYHIVERYTQLRDNFSIRDDNGNIICESIFGQNNKPLSQLSGNLPKWILPEVSCKKKIYKRNPEIMEDDDIVSIKNNGNELLEQENIQKKYYHKKSKYNYPQYVDDENNFTSQFDDIEKNVNNIESNFLKKNFEFSYDHESFIDESVIFKSNKFIKSNNIFQRFLKDDIMDIQSIILMPKEVVEFSKISLQNINIMTRTSWNNHYLSYFQLFDKYTNNKGIHMDKKVVTLNFIPLYEKYNNDGYNLDIKSVKNFEGINFAKNEIEKMCYKNRPKRKRLTEEEYKKEKENAINEKFITNNFLKKSFLKKVSKYIIDENNKDLKEDKKKMEKFLYTIIPNTYELIDILPLSDSLMKNYTFVEYVNNILEPFMIYPQNIHYTVYSKIRRLLITKINDYIHKVKKQEGIISKIKNRIVKTGNRNENTIHQFVSTKELYQANTYNSSSEELISIMDSDGGNGLSHLICSRNLHLVINPSFVENVLLNDSNNDNNCSSRFIAKKYLSLNDLENDNNKEAIYFDKEYDDSPYELVNKFKMKLEGEEEITKEIYNEKYEEFLQEKLIEKKLCSKFSSEKLVRTLILGKKKIVDEYAILEMNNELSFYKRHEDKWIIEENLKLESFMNNNTIFCNIDKKCMKDKNVKTCESIDNYKNIYIDEFKLRLDDLDKRLVNETNEKLEKVSKFPKRNKKLLEVQLYKQNYFLSDFGKLNIDDVQKSPYINLRGKIFGYHDKIKKWSYLLTFVEKYTRSAFIDIIGEDDTEEEDHNWLYCKETNTKLLPKIYFELAKAFNVNMEVFNQKQSEICSQFGEKGVDGFIVDIFLGLYIKEIDFVNNDEYDEMGGKIINHAVIDIEKIEGSFNMNTEIIDSIYTKMCKYLSINKNATVIFYDFVLSKSIVLIDKIDSKEKYDSQVEYIKLKNISGKKIMEYHLFLQERIISIVVSLLFISIQTAIPSLKNEELFSGFPMEEPNDVNNEQGINTIIEALKGLSKTNTPIFKDLTSFNNLKVKIKKDILNLLITEDIKMLYDKKSKHEISNKIKELNNSDKYNKWVGILPPIVEFSVKDKVINVEKDFHNEFLNLIRNCDKRQRACLSSFRSKITIYGYAIIELINDVVKKKKAILKTKSNVYYLQNACCNDANFSNLSTLKYFISENEILLSYISNSLKCELVLSDYKDLASPFLFYNDEDTSRSSFYNDDPENKNERLISQTIMYMGFIYHLNYDKNKGLPKKFIKFEKPLEYDSSMKIEDKIEVLGTKIYNSNTFDNILKEVFKEKIVPKEQIFPNYEKYDANKELNHFLHIENENIITTISTENTIKELIRIMIKEKEQPDILKDFILTTNDKMKGTILENIQRYTSSLSSKEIEKFSSNLNSISNWGTWNLYKNLKRSSITIIINFIKNSILNLCHVYPSMINNKVIAPISSNRSKLSQKHNMDIEIFQKKNLFTYFNSLNVDNSEIFEIDRNELDTIIAFMEKIQFSEKMDDQVCEGLFTFCWYSVFRVYIDSCNNIIEESKNNNQILKEKTVKMLSIFLEIETENKNLIDQSYLEISDKIFKETQREKKLFVNLKNKDLENIEKRLTMEMKKLNIGIWAEGKKGLVKYDKDAYDNNGDDGDDENYGNQGNEENEENQENQDDIYDNNDILDANNDDENDTGDGDGNNNDDDENTDNM